MRCADSGERDVGNSDMGVMEMDYVTENNWKLCWAAEKVQVMLDDHALMPVRGHRSDAGLDLRSPGDVTIRSMDSATIDTGVHILIPHGYAGELVSKSGLNVNHDITSTGLIDAGYTGSIKVKLYNLGLDDYQVHKGDKISQLIIIPVKTPEMVLVSDFPETERGDNGFGSTGA